MCFSNRWPIFWRDIRLIDWTPEAAAGGVIGLVKNGDLIKINIPMRSISLAVSDDELDSRRKELEGHGWKPKKPRPRNVTPALKAYSKLATSADKGAVRDLSQLG